MKFTDKEIELCKEIAKYYIKPIKYGDWFCYVNYENENYIRIYQKEPYAMPEYDRTFPLWSLEDCLGWLKEKEFIISIMGQYPDDESWLLNCGRKHSDDDLHHEGKTPLEACLKTILEILKKEQKC